MSDKILKTNDKVYKEVQVITLPVNNYQKTSPTEFIGHLFKHDNGVYSILTDVEEWLHNNSYLNAVPHDIYFISNEKVCDNDTVIYENKPHKVFSGKDCRIPMGLLITKGYRQIVVTDQKKVISTTNQDIDLSMELDMINNIWVSVKYPKPSKDFIKAFVENNGIDRVYLEYQKPNENGEYKLKISEDNSIIAYIFKNIYYVL